MLRFVISATHPSKWFLLYSVFKEIGWLVHLEKGYHCSWWNVVFKTFFTEHEEKQFNVHLHTTSPTDNTPFSSLQYCQQHKVKNCVLTTVAIATNYGVKFFWILGMKEMCVTFLNVKKSNQKPSGDVYCLGWNFFNPISKEVSATLQVITSTLAVYPKHLASYQTGQRHNQRDNFCYLHCDSDQLK